MGRRDRRRRSNSTESIDEGTSLSSYDENHPENKKREYEPDFNGAVKNRSCTDVICLVLFIIFLLAEVVVAYFAFSQGDPKNLIYPTDYEGNICGFGTKADKKNLFYFDLVQCARTGIAGAFTGCPTVQLCVEECPNSDWVYLPDASRPAKERADKLICKYDFVKSTSDDKISKLVGDETCAAYYIKSKPVFNRCIPAFLADAANSAVEKFNPDNQDMKNKDGKTIDADLIKLGNEGLSTAATTAEAVARELEMGVYWMIGIIAIGAILCFLWCLLMKYFACVAVMFTLIIFFIFFSAVSAFSVYQFFTVPNSSNGTFVVSTNFTVYTQLKEFWLGIAIVAGILTLIVLIILVFLRGRIRIAIAIIGEASKMIGAIMSALFFPLIPLLLEIIVAAYWGATTIFLLSVVKKEYNTITIPGLAEKTTNTEQMKAECGDVVFSDPNYLKCLAEQNNIHNWPYILIAYNTFMAFWLFAFATGFCQIVLAGAFCSWYWAWKKPADIPSLPIIASLGRILRYHLGTVAFGSLIIAIVQMIRAVLMYFERKLKGRENCLAKFCLKALICCFWCLEKIVKFITKNAYIMTAMLGKSFIPAAASAFFLILRNCLRLVVVDNVTAFVLAIAKLCICALVAVLSYYLFNDQIPGLEKFEFEYFYAHMIVCILLTFAIATLFFNVFEFAVDTMFLCVMEDLERNDGSPEKPYYMSRDVMKVMGKKNKFDDSKREGCCACCSCCCC